MVCKQEKMYKTMLKVVLILVAINLKRILAGMSCLIRNGEKYLMHCLQGPETRNFGSFRTILSKNPNGPTCLETR